MFRSARWRIEKNKIKAVFKLQFHATQVPQSGVDALMISVVPGDVGKPTMRLEKAVVRDGSCQWENPVCETVTFVRELKTGKINKKIYHFIVSTGSSKAGLVGEVSVDFADYAEAVKASTVSLPLKNPYCKAVLHVSIQRLQADVDPREVEENEDANFKSQDRSLKSQLSIGDADESITPNSIDDGLLHKSVRNSELNGNRTNSSGSDITLSSSESSSGLNTPRELGMRNNDIHQDPTRFLSSVSPTSVPNKPAVNASATIREEQQRSQWEWSVSSDHGISTDDSTNSSQDTFPREGSQQSSDVEIEKLKTELVALARQVDVSELELQTLRKQIVKESKRGHDLSREVICLKEERDALKSECQKLNDFQKRMDDVKLKNKSQYECGDPWALLEEIRQELNYEKDLNANLRVQLQKMQESNAELILAVQDLDELLEQKNKEISSLSTISRSRENAEDLRETVSRCDTDDEEQKALEELVREHRDAKETYLLEQKIMDLYSEIEIYRRDKDELEMQMEQLALDYEILKQENHDISYKLEQSQLQEQLKMQYECSSTFANINDLEIQIENLESELKTQSKEFSDALATINDFETNIKCLEEELERQAQGFEADLEALTNAKVEQEQRAIRAEEALQRTRWKNANTAERLQEEFRRLSVQMASTFEANEKVAMKAMTEASELRMQASQLEDMLQRANEELQLVKENYEARLHDLSNQLTSKLNQIEKMKLDIDDKTKQLEHQKKHEEDITEGFSREILRLKAETERLMMDNLHLSEQTEEKENLKFELEQMKSSMKETEVLLRKGNIERNELVSAIALMQKEAEKSLEELKMIQRLKDEKETSVEHLQTEMEMLKAQYNDLKHSLVEEELEKEKLRKQVCQLKSDIKKKEDALTNTEKKLKDSNGRRIVSDGSKTTPRNNKSASVPHGSKEVANLREKIKVLEGHIKHKETALENSTKSFLEKEKDLLNRIEELQSRLEELNQNTSSLCDNQIQKVKEDAVGGISEEENDIAEYRTSKENGNAVTLIESNDSNLTQKELEVSANNNDRHGNNDEFFSELESLKERNKSMESELKEMQERYSEISLKFAEVEGERQQLVMTVRNLKNAMKS